MLIADKSYALGEVDLSNSKTDPKKRENPNVTDELYDTPESYVFNNEAGKTLKIIMQSLELQHSTKVHILENIMSIHGIIQTIKQIIMI